MVVEYDVLSPEFRADREGVYQRLRDEAPVFLDPAGRFAALSRFQDVRTASLDWKSFSAVTAEAKILRPIINDMDPPLHTNRRKNMSRAFTRRGVAEMEPQLRRMARSLIAGFADRGSCDLVAEFAALFPSMVMGQLIGIPDDLLAACRSITDAVMRIEGPEGNASPVERADSIFSALVHERRLEPRDDLISALLAVESDGGEPLSDDEILGFCYLLLVGGNDTTTNLIGNGMELLARHPDQRAAIVKDPELVPNAVEEMLRREPPTLISARQTTSDLTLHGQAVPAGTRVLLMWGAAILMSASSRPRLTLTCGGMQTDTSRWGRAPTFVWVPHSPGWKPVSRLKNCWLACRSSRLSPNQNESVRPGPGALNPLPLSSSRALHSSIQRGLSRSRRASVEARPAAANVVGSSDLRLV